MKLNLVLLALCPLAVPAARANVIIQFSQQVDGVHADVSGFLDLAPLSHFGTFTISASTDIAPDARFFDILPGIGTYSIYLLPPSTVPIYGTNTGITGGTWVSGEFALEFNGSGGDFLYLSPSYASGDPLSASAVYPGTFATYGFPVNDVVANLPGSQTVTFSFNSVPEPSTLTIAAAALALMAGIWRRRLRGS